MGLMETLKRVKEAFTGRAQSEEAAAVEEISMDEEKTENEGIQEATKAPEETEDMEAVKSIATMAKRAVKDAEECIGKDETDQLIKDMAAGKDISGYELTEEQKEALAAAGQRLVEAFKPIGEAIAKAFEQVVETQAAVAKEIGKLNLGEWELQKLEESNNHRRMHGKPMIRKKGDHKGAKIKQEQEIGQKEGGEECVGGKRRKCDRIRNDGSGQNRGQEGIRGGSSRKQEGRTEGNAVQHKKADGILHRPEKICRKCNIRGKRSA